jgi:nucleotide-binding universal stress UspA family protein
MTTTTDHSAIAVGVDGSDCSEKALGWAVEEAVRRGCTLRVIHAWYHLGQAAGLGLATLADPQVLHDSSQAMVERMVGPWREKYPDADITVTLAETAPVTALIEASRTADLVVVGSRGHGGLATLMLGSVSNALAHHSECPVVIVRGR